MIKRIGITAIAIVLSSGALFAQNEQIVYIDGAKYTVYNAREFFNFVYEYRCFIKQVLDLGLQSTVYEAFCEVMKPQFSTGAAECYRSRLYSYGLFGLLGEWNNRGYSETPDEMVNYYNKMMGIA